MYATGAAGLTRQFAVYLAFKSAFQPVGEAELDSRFGLDRSRLGSFRRDDGGERQPFRGLQIRVVALQGRSEELVGLRHEEFRVLVERSVIGVGVDDELRVRQVLLQD